MTSKSACAIHDDLSPHAAITQQENWDDVRAENYNHLKWANDNAYIEALVRFSELERQQLVLDLGTGTGIIAQAASPHVNEVIAIDISHNMIKQAPHISNISFVRWDAKDPLFAPNVFDRIISRMAFHNFGDNCEKIMENCLRYLKPGGKLIIAEGVPPADEPEAVEWYTEMFKMKEDRLVFTCDILKAMMTKAGFQNIKFDYHYFDEFDVVNWLENSGLPKDLQAKIIDVHKEMPEHLKQLYKMRISGSEILIRTRNLLISGEKTRAALA